MPPSYVSNSHSHGSPRLVVFVMPLSETDQEFLQVAISEAQAGFDEGGIPIGACLVSREGKLIAKGRNLRMQKCLVLMEIY